MSKARGLTFLIIFFSFFISGYSQVIENLDFVQEGKNIRITYDLIGTEEGQQFDVEVYFSSDGGRTWQGPLQEVTGHVGPNKSTGRFLIIIWDVLAEKKSLVGEVQFKIDAKIIDNNIGDSVILKNTPSKKGYIGMSFGVAIPILDFNSFGPTEQEESKYNAGPPKTGFQINIIEFGYLLSRNFGIAANGCISHHQMELNGREGYWRYFCFTGGLLISFPFERFQIDFKTMGGILYIKTDGSDIKAGDGSSFVVDFGPGIRIHLSKKLSMLINADVLWSKPTISSHMNDYEFTHKIHVLNLTGGIVYQLK